MSRCQSSSVSPGKPYIRSMLIFWMPLSRSRSIASVTWCEECLRCSHFSRSSLNVCAPMLTRFTGSIHSPSAKASVTSSGFISMVTSASISTLLYLYTASKIWCNCGMVNWLGVPPPRYIVAMLWSSFSFFLFLTSSISFFTASTYRWRSLSDVVE